MKATLKNVYVQKMDGAPPTFIKSQGRYPFDYLEIGDRFVLDYPICRGTAHGICQDANARLGPAAFIAHLQADGKYAIWRVE